MTKCLTRKYGIFNYKSHNNEQCRKLDALVFTYSISIKKIRPFMFIWLLSAKFSFI